MYGYAAPLNRLYRNMLEKRESLESGFASVQGYGKGSLGTHRVTSCAASKGGTSGQSYELF